MAEPCLTYDDPREISAIHEAGDDGAFWRVGYAQVTRIVAYKEHGLSDFVPWFAVYQGDHLATRVPGHTVSVSYARATGSGE